MAEAKERYSAFISYSWTDKIWGERLHRWLEGYRAPKGALADPARSRRLGKFFRDDEDMPAGGDIGVIVRDAIQRSDNLIVLCSPSAANSQWVRAEIEEFQRSNTSGYVFAVIVDGTPNATDPSQECFPEPLRRAHAGGGAMPVEPVGVDLRRDGRDRTCARLAAGILRIDFDDLWQRDRRRAEARQRTRLATLSALSVTFAGLLVLAVVNAHNAHLALSRFFAERVWQKLDSDETLLASRYALAGSQLAPQNEALYWAALGAAMQASGESAPAMGHGDSIASAAISPDGAYVITGGRDAVARLWRVADASPRATLLAGIGPVSAVAWAPRGSYAAIGTESGVLVVQDVQRNRSVATLRGHHGAIATATFFDDGRRLLTLGDDHTIRIWTIDTGASIVLGDGERIWSVRLSPNERLAAAAREDGSVILYDVERGSIAARLTGHAADVYAVAFSPSGAQLVTAGADATAIVWDVAARRRVLTLKAHALEIFDVAFSPDGRRILTASVDQTAKLWDAHSGAALATLSGHTSHVTHAIFSADGKKIVTAGQDGSARIWDASDGAPLAVLRGHAGAITSLGMTPDGDTILTASRDGRARLWNVDRSGLAARLSMQSRSVHSVEFARDGASLLATDDAGRVRVWDTRNWTQRMQFRAHDDEVYSAVPSSDGRVILTVGADGARLWDQAGRKLQVFGENRDRMMTATLSPDSTRVMTGGESGEARIWNAMNGALLTTLKGHTDSVRSASFSPDGRFAVTASEDTTARIWDVRTGALVTTLSEHRLGVGGVAYSPDGASIVTSSDDASAILWDVARRRVRVKLLGHRGGIYSAAFSPDGRRIATASEDRTARIWDARDGRLMATFDAAAAVFGVAFSPDSVYLAAASEDGFVRIWNVHRLTQPWATLALDACTTLLDAPGHRFAKTEIQSDGLLAAEWPSVERDVCRHVRGAQTISARKDQGTLGARSN